MYLEQIEIGFLIEIIAELNKLANNENEDVIIGDEQEYKEFGF